MTGCVATAGRCRVCCTRRSAARGRYLLAAAQRRRVAAARRTEPGARRSGGARGDGADRRRRRLSLLDVQRQRAWSDDARAARRHRRDRAAQRAGQLERAQHQPARRDWSGRWRETVAGGAGWGEHVPFPGASPGRLRLPLHDPDGRQPRRQRDVRHGRRRAAQWLVAGRSRVLPDAGATSIRKGSTTSLACRLST